MSGFFKSEDDNPLAKYPKKRGRREVFTINKTEEEYAGSEPQATTPCECKFSGSQTGIFCDRHQCIKSRSLHRLCQTRQSYFDMWEEGDGPMQDPLNRIMVEKGKINVTQTEQEGTTFFNAEGERVFPNKNEYFMGDPEIPKKSRGLGDTIAKFTKATGLKKATKTVFGAFNKDCGCSERQAKLNRMFPYENGEESNKKTKGFFE